MSWYQYIKKILKIQKINLKLTFHICGSGHETRIVSPKNIMKIMKLYFQPI